MYEKDIYKSHTLFLEGRARAIGVLLRAGTIVTESAREESGGNMLPVLSEFAREDFRCWDARALVGKKIQKEIASKRLRYLRRWQKLVSIVLLLLSFYFFPFCRTRSSKVHERIRALSYPSEFDYLASRCPIVLFICLTLISIPI